MTDARRAQVHDLGHFIERSRAPGSAPRRMTGPAGSARAWRRPHRRCRRRQACDARTSTPSARRRSASSRWRSSGSRRFDTSAQLTEDRCRARPPAASLARDPLRGRARRRRGTGRDSRNRTPGIPAPATSSGRNRTSSSRSEPPGSGSATCGCELSTRKTSPGSTGWTRRPNRKRPGPSRHEARSRGTRAVHPVGYRPRSGSRATASGKSGSEGLRPVEDGHARTVGANRSRRRDRAR